MKRKDPKFILVGFEQLNVSWAMPNKAAKDFIGMELEEHTQERFFTQVFDLFKFKGIEGRAKIIKPKIRISYGR